MLPAGRSTSRDKTHQPSEPGAVDGPRRDGVGRGGLFSFFFLSLAGGCRATAASQRKKERKRSSPTAGQHPPANERGKEKREAPGEGFPTCPACAALRRGCLADSVSRRPPGAARNVSSSSHAGASAFSRFDPAKRQSGAAPAVFRVERSARHFARPAVSREKRGHSAWFRPGGAVPPPRLLPLKTAKRTSARPDCATRRSVSPDCPNRVA